MKNLFVVILLLLSTNLSLAFASNDADVLFNAGKEAIGDNCADCRNSTREGLEKGIEDVIKSLDIGYGNKLEAFILLRDAYIALAYAFDVPDSEDQEEHLDEVRKVNKELKRLSPDDVGILYEYIKHEEDDSLKVEALRKILSKKPKNAKASFLLGNLLIEKGSVKEGAKELKEALKNAENIDYQRMRRRALNKLKKKGLNKEFDELKNEFGKTRQLGKTTKQKKNN